MVSSRRDLPRCRRGDGEEEAATLVVRNIDASPADPVENWPTEAVITALERGGLSDWHRLGEAIRTDPWGPVARRLETALTCVQPYGVDVSMRRIRSPAPNADGVTERDQSTRLMSPATWKFQRPVPGRRRSSYGTRSWPGHMPVTSMTDLTKSSTCGVSNRG